MSDVVNLNTERAKSEDNNTLCTVEEFLEDIYKEERASEEKSTKAIYLALDDSDDSYAVSYRMSNITLSEMVALLEVIKNRIIAEDMFG